MLTILDTNIAIRLRDGDEESLRRVSARPGTSAFSTVTRVELEGGVYKEPADSAVLRRRLDYLLESFEELPFGPREAAAYGAIVAASGFSRPRILDRMIAATALVADATLVTNDPGDFADIAGLKLEAW